MPRQLRIEYPGAVYHVMARGNNREKIYRSDRDRACFLDTVEEVCDQTGWGIHAYVLMGNHYHMLLETPEPNLVAGMKWFQGTYTQRFNSAHRRNGHVFQGRYKSLIIDAEEGDYFNRVSTYIHLNPFRARLAGAGTGKPLEAYVWSSYPAYLVARRRRPSWLTVGRTLEGLGMLDESRKSRLRYQEYIEGRMIDESEASSGEEFREEYKAIRRGWVFGGEAFRDWALERIDERVAGEPDRLRGDTTTDSRRTGSRTTSDQCLGRSKYGRS